MERKKERISLPQMASGHLKPTTTTKRPNWKLNLYITGGRKRKGIMRPLRDKVGDSAISEQKKTHPLWDGDSVGWLPNVQSI